MTPQKKNDARIELAFELATYIHKHPNYPAEGSLPWRIHVLTNKPVMDPDFDLLVREVEHWLEEIEKSEGDA